MMDGIQKTFALFNAKGIVDELLCTGFPAISWNHAKLVAVNGSTMMTGGGNFWGEYKYNEHDIVDMQAKIMGDAAVSVHKYCDYFWEYLNALPTQPGTGSRSFACTRKLVPGSHWGDVRTTPSFGNTSFPANAAAPAKTIPVLTVSKLGDWTGDMASIKYPVQFVDALRDVSLNVAWEVFDISWDSVVSKEKLVAVRAGAFGMVLDNLDDAKMKTYLNNHNIHITPAAWASRTARCTAIGNAQKSVHICSELFATFIGGKKGAAGRYNDFVDKEIGRNLPEGHKWDGRMWPFGRYPNPLIALHYGLSRHFALTLLSSSDLLKAFATFLDHLQSLPSDKITDQHGIWIVITSSHPHKHEDWEDKSSVGELRARVKALMFAQWAKAQMLPEIFSNLLSADKWPIDKISELVDKRFHVGRIMNDAPPHLCHAKNICVDRDLDGHRLMYIGSDNTYPTYNEEHGVWVQNKTAIDHWRDDFWEGLWQRSSALPSGRDALSDAEWKRQNTKTG